MFPPVSDEWGSEVPWFGLCQPRGFSCFILLPHATLPSPEAQETSLEFKTPGGSLEMPRCGTGGTVGHFCRCSSATPLGQELS
jgi:hypothetical protein